MRVAVVTRYFPSSAEPWQGRSAYQTLRILAREADVHVFFPNASYPRWLSPRTRLYQSLDLSYRPPDVNVSYHHYPALPLLSRSLNGSLAARVLLPHVRAFRPDLLFGLFLYPEGFAALRIGNALSVPVLVQGIGSDINSTRDPICAMHTRNVLRQADLVATVSDALRQKAVAMGAHPDRTRAILNGCDLSVFHVRGRSQAREQLRIDKAAKVVVFIGRIDVRKGLRELVKAAAALHSTQPSLHVYLVGEGPDHSILRQAIHAAHAAAYIHAAGSCSPHEVPLWMAAADLVTLPSYMEGCPNVVLEALACGRPVVATRVGGIPEILNDHCGRLVPARDPRLLAQALASVLDCEWDAEAISARMSRSWDTVAAELRALFEQLTPAPAPDSSIHRERKGG